MTRDEKIQNNLGLVHSCAMRFKGRGIEYDDLYSAGCVGLIKAVDRFEEERGLCFSTYAVPVILGEIRRLFRDGGTVKVSRRLKELSMYAAKASAQFSAKEGRQPTVNELAEILCVEKELLTEAINAGMQPVSLTFDDDTGGGQMDIPVDPPEEKLTELISLQQILEDLEEKDRSLITLRFFKRKTQSETGRLLNMTQVQVSRREKKILCTLREKLQA